MGFSKTVETSSKSIPCFCLLIAFFSSSHVNFIGNTVYTVRIYVKWRSIFIHLPNVAAHWRRARQGEAYSVAGNSQLIWFSSNRDRGADA